MTECPGVAMAADIFAKIGDIKGESLDDKHKDEVEVLSLLPGHHQHRAHSFRRWRGCRQGHIPGSFHRSQNRQGISEAAGACATGQHLKEATITFRKAGKGRQEFLIVKMNDVIITGVVQSAPGSEAGSETVNLEFAKVDWEFKPQKADGSLDAGIHFKFNIQSNKVG